MEHEYLPPSAITKNMESPHPPLEIGQKQEKSSLSNLTTQEGDSTILKMSSVSSVKIKVPLKKCFQGKGYSMLESLLNTNAKTSKDKLISLSPNILTIDSSPTSDQDSIGNGKVLKPFWTKSTMIMSQKLWSPTKIACVDLDMNFSNGSVKNTKPESWFSIQSQKQTTEPKNWQKIYSLLSLCSSLRTMESAPPSTASTELKVKRYRMFPNKNQIQTLKQWFGTYRYLYNKGLAVLKNRSYNPSESLQTQFRQQLVNEDYYYSHPEFSWVLDLPYDSRDYAIKELLQAFRTNCQSGHHFDMKYKSKKKSQSMTIRSRQYDCKSGKYSFISQIPLMYWDKRHCGKTKTTTKKKKKELKRYRGKIRRFCGRLDLQHDIEIQWDADGRFYMLVPVDVIPKTSTLASISTQGLRKYRSN